MSWTADAGPPGVATVFERLQGGDYAGASQAFAAPALYAIGTAPMTNPHHAASPRARGRSRALHGPEVLPQLRICIYDDRDCSRASFASAAHGRAVRHMAAPRRGISAATPHRCSSATSVISVRAGSPRRSRPSRPTSCLSTRRTVPERRGRCSTAATSCWTGSRTRAGRRPHDRSSSSHLQAGRDCFIEGVVDGIPDGGSFVSSLSLDRKGSFSGTSRFYSASRVERL